mmetsp:Transcript_80592/g.184610  ORF Transcript_80592/g.184610 Transcript_80592/m.184610 type:complete len:321 (+) Transcript_80592:2-964(+)
MNMVDLLAILPFYVGLLAPNYGGGSALRVARIVRLVRLFRMIKERRVAKSLSQMLLSFMHTRQAISVLFCLLFGAIVLLSSVLYFAERTGCVDRASLSPQDRRRYEEECMWGPNIVEGIGYCCDERGSSLAFLSIPSTMWWAVVTLGCVGFGDHVPRTALGQIIAIVCMLGGVLLLALPVAIVGAKFTELLNVDAGGESFARKRLRRGYKGYSTNTCDDEDSLPGQKRMPSVKIPQLPTRPRPVGLGQMESRAAMKRYRELVEHLHVAGNRLRHTSNHRSMVAKLAFEAIEDVFPDLTIPDDHDATTAGEDNGAGVSEGL